MTRPFFLMLVLFGASAAIGQVPDPTITTTSTYNGYATVGGRLNAKAEGPVGISIRNGNLMYATITDLDGRWATVIRLQSTKVDVQSWSLTTPNERSEIVYKTIK